MISLRLLPGAVRLATKARVSTGTGYAVWQDRAGHRG
jgi:hypothetical protein